MYKVNNLSGTVYLYDTGLGKVIIKFNTFADVLKYVSCHLSILDSVNCGDLELRENFTYEKFLNSDGEIYYKKYSWGYSYGKKYLFYDGYNRIIDVRNYIEEINKLSECDKPYYDYERLIDARYTYNYGIYKSPAQSVRDKLNWEKHYPVFRRGPVSHVGRNKAQGNYYRKMRTLNEMRQNADPEVQQYIRPCRNLRNLPNEYDDEKVRPHPKSWKDCTKKRKQWMK